MYYMCPLDGYGGGCYCTSISLVSPCKGKENLAKTNKMESINKRYLPQCWIDLLVLP